MVNRVGRIRTTAVISDETPGSPDPGRARAFYGVLGLTLIFGIIVYRIAMESAVEMAESKEAIVSALSRGEGPG